MLNEQEMRKEELDVLWIFTQIQVRSARPSRTRSPGGGSQVSVSTYQR